MWRSSRYKPFDAMRCADGAQLDARRASVATLQYCALISMAIDHLGAVGWLLDWSRIVGRFALPAFVVMIAHNALVASEPGRMVARLLVLLLVSQPLWALSVGSWDRLCILVTLAAVVAMVWAWRAGAWYRCALILVLFGAISPWVEYGLWPIMLVPFVLFPHYSTALLALVWPMFQYDSPVFYWSAMVGVIIALFLLHYPIYVKRAPRWLTRWFYPLHLAAIKIAT